MRLGVSWVALVTLAAASAPRTVVDFSNEVVGSEPKSVVPVVGYWGIADDGGNKVLVIDGRRWRQGEPSANLADKARSLYGERYAEFLDSVQAYAYFPYAVVKGIDGFSEGEVSLRFKALSGRIDQAAGIVFGLKPNGDYLALRANPLENNLVLWQFVRGKRSSVKWIRNTPTPTGTWLTLRLKVTGRNVEGYLGDTLFLQHTLDQPVSGRLGIWSKADSHVHRRRFHGRPPVRRRYAAVARFRLI